MIAAKNWRAWTRSSKVAWSLALMGSASAGLFLGLDNPAHSDMAKYTALLAQHERMPGELIVKLSPKGAAELQTLNLEQVLDGSRFQIAAANRFETDPSMYVVKLAGDAQTAQFLEAANSNPAIKYAEPNYIVHAMGMQSKDADAPQEVVPNDPGFNQLWGLKNTGQKDSDGTVGLPGADIGVTKAWAKTTGNPKIVVAVIDTGVDYTHPELKDNIYVNPGESGNGKETNGIDDDGNGFVDDFHGWNFSSGTSTNNPMDDNEHGTHVSGTIAAKGNNGIGVAGINWTSSILPVKFLSADGSGTLADAVKAIQYATLMHANIMSNSWGGGGYTQSMFDAIKAANDQGELFVAAAGNDSDDADNSPHYPAGYQIDNVISVAASTNRDTLADFSTYGRRTVHIAAPGNNVYSTVPNGGYATFSGTSMATPHVSGAAALLWGTDPSMTAAQVKDRILRSRDFVPALARFVSSGGRLNVYNAIMGIYPPSPEPQESDWHDVTFQGPIESAHPYDNSQTQSWTIQGPENAKFMRVVLSKVDMEANYDFVKVLDGNGTEMDAISGQLTEYKSYYVVGNKLTIKFTSDSSNTGWGFAVEKVQAAQ